jgi:Fibrobacter succinogenes major domain (Fib_succ_major)
MKIMKQSSIKLISTVCILLSVVLLAVGELQAQTVIGGTNGNASAVLELRSNDRGLLLPRLTSAERSAIVSPAEGLVIYNTTEGCIEINLGSSASPDWNCLLAITGRVGSVDIEAATQTGALTAGAVASGVSFSIPYIGGNGSFYNAQTVSSTGVTGLTATRAAGTFAEGSGSVTYEISGTPSGTGTASFALSVGGQSCTLSRTVSSASGGGGCGAYVASGVWKEFMCHNLGANTSADPFTPSWELNGNYYQWGRNPTCFGRDGEDAANPCSSPVYGAAAPWGNTTANDNAGIITGWSTTNAPNGNWSDGSKTVNDPCPAGWRVPTAAQLMGMGNGTLNPLTWVGTWTGGTTNYSVGFSFGQSLFLPAAGSRYFSDGSLGGRGSDGYYWSSTESGIVSQFLSFNINFINVYTSNRPSGFSLRCIAE